MGLILDGVVIFLLVVAIIYGVILNRKIVLIQNSKKDLANLFKSFDNTILKAQIGIDDLKKVSNEVSHVLQGKIDKASILLEDLSFLSEKVIELTNKVERTVNNAKGAPAQPAERTYDPEYIKSMRESAKRQNDLVPAPAKVSAMSDPKKTKLLEGMLEKIAEKRASKEAISNDNKGLLNNVSVAKKDKEDEKTVANVLRSLGYGE